MQVTDPGFGIQTLSKHFIYNKSTMGSGSLLVMFEVFNGISWLTIFASVAVMTFLSILFYNSQNFEALIWSFSTIAKALFAQSFDTTNMKKELKNSKHFLIFSTSFFGGFIFWYYTGILTSFLAVPSKESPIKSLDDLLDKTDFKLHLGQNWASGTQVHQWAKKDKKNEEAYNKFVIPNFVTVSTKEIVKFISQDTSPNQALILSAWEFDLLGNIEVNLNFHFFSLPYSSRKLL